MSGCQWLCLSKPPRRVFIDSPGRPANLDFKGPSRPHTCLELFWVIRLQVEAGWIYTGNYLHPCNRKNDKGRSRLSLTVAERKEVVCQVENACTECVSQWVKTCGGDCRSIYVLPPFQSCFSCSCIWTKSSAMIITFRVPSSNHRDDYCNSIWSRQASQATCIPFSIIGFCSFSLTSAVPVQISLSGTHY